MALVSVAQMRISSIQDVWRIQRDTSKHLFTGTSFFSFFIAKHIIILTLLTIQHLILTLLTIQHLILALLTIQHLILDLVTIQ